MKFLKETSNRNGFQNIIMYGRRRVGKTAICLEFLKQKTGTYFLVQKSGNQAQELTNKFAKENNIFPEETNTFKETFRFIHKNVKGRYVIAIDEFPYLIQEDTSIPSQFQSIIDEELQDSPIMLLLLGSSVSIIEDEVLAHKSPLYGRRTGQMKIQPFTIREIAQLFPKKSQEELIEIYGTLDGIPAYLKQFEPKKTTLENIQQHILEKEHYLFEEADFLLNQELREPKKYKAILYAISNGKNRMSEIAKETGIAQTVIPKYLDTLLTLEIITRKTSINEKDVSRNTIYDFNDNFFRFYFRFVYPNIMLLEERKIKTVIKEIKQEFQTYLGMIFEEVCRQYLRKSGEYTRVGSYWSKGVEIDVIGTNKEKTFIAECKYKDDVDYENEMKRLQGKKHPFEKNVSYEIFAKSFKQKNKGIDLNTIYKGFLKQRGRR